MSKKDLVSLILSVVGGILFALGMCMALLPEWGAMTQGIVIGVTGITGTCAAYPLYAHITKKQRRKLAPEIMRLTDELMK